MCQVHATSSIMASYSHKFLLRLHLAFHILLNFSTTFGYDNIAKIDHSLGYFNGSAYITENSSLDFFTSNVAFSFKTCQDDGTLLHQVSIFFDFLSYQYILAT